MTGCVTVFEHAASKESFQVVSFYFILYKLIFAVFVQDSELGGKKMCRAKIYSFILSHYLFILKLLSSQFCIGSEAFEAHSVEFILLVTNIDLILRSRHKGE